MPEQPTKVWKTLQLTTALGSGSGMGGTVLYLDKIAPEQINSSDVKQLARDMQYHLRNHPDTVNQFDRRLTRLEAQIEILQAESRR